MWQARWSPLVGRYLGPAMLTPCGAAPSFPRRQRDQAGLVDPAALPDPEHHAQLECGTGRPALPACHQPTLGPGQRSLHAVGGASRWSAATPSADGRRCKGHRQTSRLSRLPRRSGHTHNRALPPSQGSGGRRQSCRQPISNSHSDRGSAESVGWRFLAATGYSATRRSRRPPSTPGRPYTIEPDRLRLGIGMDVGTITSGFE